MADARRFPRLELPFALVGAAGGFLSVEIVSSPRRLCIGRKYAYRLDEPDAMSRAASDRGGVHAIVVFVAGAIIGALVGADCNCEYGAPSGAISGAFCSLVFLPVVMAVLRSARSAKRARLGTLVARADYRAVWSVLATALALTTLEAIPDWLERGDGTVAVAIACECGAIVLVVLLWDGRANRAARATLADLAAPTPLAEEARTIDLGLGEGVGARVARGRSAYRDRDHTLALVRGDPFEVRQAPARALVRGRASFALISAVLGVHVIAALVGR